MSRQDQKQHMIHGRGCLPLASKALTAFGLSRLTDTRCRTGVTRSFRRLLRVFLDFGNRTWQVVLRSLTSFNEMALKICALKSSLIIRYCVVSHRQSIMWDKQRLLPPRWYHSFRALHKYVQVIIIYTQRLPVQVPRIFENFIRFVLTHNIIPHLNHPSSVRLSLSAGSYQSS